MVWIPRDEQEIDDVKSLFAQQQWQSDIGGGGGGGRERERTPKGNLPGGIKRGDPSE